MPRQTICLLSLERLEDRNLLSDFGVRSAIVSTDGTQSHASENANGNSNSEGNTRTEVNADTGRDRDTAASVAVTQPTSTVAQPATYGAVPKDMVAKLLNEVNVARATAERDLTSAVTGSETAQKQTESAATTTAHSATIGSDTVNLPQPKDVNVTPTGVSTSSETIQPATIGVSHGDPVTGQSATVAHSGSVSAAGVVSGGTASVVQSTPVEQSSAAAAVSAVPARPTSSGGTEPAVAAAPGLSAVPGPNSSAKDQTTADLACVSNPAAVTDAALAASLPRDLAADAGRLQLMVASPTSLAFADRVYFPGMVSDTPVPAGRATPAGEFLPVSLTAASDEALQLAVPSLVAADLLNGATPQDAFALDLGVRQFLGQIDDLGREVTRTLQDTNVALWVAAAALGAFTYELARRRRLRARLALGFAAGPDHLGDSWVPGLSGPLGSEEA
jgi:hypothetical protein